MRFLLVDSILELKSGQAAVGVKNVTMSEDFLALHFPNFPVMPGTLIAEALVQLADWVIRESTAFQQMGTVVAFEQLKFRQMVRPGDQLRLSVNILERDDSAAKVQGKAVCGEVAVAAARFTLALQPLEPLLAPEDARKLFDSIARCAERV
ncbi:MAG: beta-hydroxyacyl-ACP dehydratase [Chloroflexota bacterium]|nr:beta-hydroxyacyl-ACP dehydratase [Chloroflexota bacterium]